MVKNHGSLPDGASSKTIPCIQQCGELHRQPKKIRRRLTVFRFDITFLRSQKIGIGSALPKYEVEIWKWHQATDTYAGLPAVTSSAATNASGIVIPDIAKARDA